MVDWRPTVSVICCTYNREAFARGHLELMRSHLGEDIEVLYVLDNCTDGTKSALEALADGHPKVRVLEHRGERGLFNCRNFGIAHARGAYIHFLDDDDSVEPGFYERACAGLQAGADAGIDIFLARLRITSGTGEAVEERQVVPDELLQQATAVGDELHVKADLFGAILQGRLYFNGANALFSTALLKRYGYCSELKKSADWLFILQAALCQRLYLVYNAQMISNYFVHSSSMSLAPDKAVWNARVFDLLLAMASQQPRWHSEVKKYCASANFHAGFAQRTVDRVASRRLYWRSFKLQPRLAPLLAIVKTLLR